MMSPKTIPTTAPMIMPPFAGTAAWAGAGQDGGKPASQPGGTASIPLIPRQILFGNPERAALRISPDGRHLSFLAPLNGVLNVWVAPVGEVGAAKPVTRDAGRGIHIYFWAYTGAHILYLQDREGDENWKVYVVDLASGASMDLTPF
jgi:hypothetical protein